MGLARRLAIAQRREQALVLGEDDPHAQPDAGQAASPGLAFDRLDQTARQPLAARQRPDREPAEIEIALHFLDQHAAQHLAAAFGDDGARAPGEFGRDSLGGFAKRAGLRYELAAILREGGGDGGRDRCCIADGGRAQD